MEIKQTIAVFGATGNMGSAVAKSLAKDAYRLQLISDDTGKLKSLQSNISTSYPTTEIEIIQSLNTTNTKPDIIILAVPYSAEAEIAPAIRQLATGKIVISIANP